LTWCSPHYCVSVIPMSTAACFYRFSPLKHTSIITVGVICFNPLKSLKTKFLCKNSVRTSQETPRLCYKTNRLMLFREKKSLFVVRTTGNTKIHSVDRMHNLSMIKYVVRVINTEP
jgi:hypothetical protein